MFQTSFRSFAVVCLAGVLCLAAGSSASAQDELSPQEMRYLVLETEVGFANSGQLAEYPLKVEVQKDTIVLNGEVPDNATRAAAERIARQILRPYNVTVVNKIRVVVPEAQAAPPGKPTPFDEKQMAGIRSLMDEHFPDLADNITVSFDTQPMPTIVLEGLIPTYEQKLEISRFLRKSFRGLPVVNNLRVRRNYEGEKSFYVVGPTGSTESNSRVTEPRRRQNVTVKQTNAETKVAIRPSDAEVAKQLGATLRADPVIKNCNIEVRIDDGVVWLSGRVESPGQKVRAIKLGSVQPGVRYVVNQLEIRPPSDEPSAITVLVPEPEDVVVYVQRYINTRVPELEDAQVRVDGNNVFVSVPANADWNEGELRDLEARLKRLNELKGYSVHVEVARNNEVKIKQDRNR